MTGEATGPATGPVWVERPTDTARPRWVRQTTRAQRLEVARLRARGLSYSQIGRAVGMSPSGVKYVLELRSERQVAPCGTPAAYTRHRRAGEVACQACVTAQREYGRERMRVWRAKRAEGGGRPDPARSQAGIAS